MSIIIRSWSSLGKRTRSALAVVGLSVATSVSLRALAAPEEDHRGDCIKHISGLQDAFRNSKRWLMIFTTGGALASLIAGTLAAAAEDKSRWRRIAAAIAAFGGGVVAIPKAAFDDPTDIQKRLVLADRYRAQGDKEMSSAQYTDQGAEKRRLEQEAEASFIDCTVEQGASGQSPPGPETLVAERSVAPASKVTAPLPDASAPKPTATARETSETHAQGLARGREGGAPRVPADTKRPSAAAVSAEGAKTTEKADATIGGPCRHDADCASGHCAFPERETVLDTQEEFAGALFGVSEDKLLGGRCSPGRIRSGVPQTDRINGNGNCASSAWGSDDPHDCSVRVHFGVPALGGLRCRIQAFAVLETGSCQ